MLRGRGGRFSQAREYASVPPAGYSEQRLQVSIRTVTVLHTGDKEKRESKKAKKAFKLVCVRLEKNRRLRRKDASVRRPTAKLSRRKSAKKVRHRALVAADVAAHRAQNVRKQRSARRTRPQRKRLTWRRLARRQRIRRVHNRDRRRCYVLPSLRRQGMAMFLL